VNRAFEIIEQLPTTRIRILITIGLIVATVVTWLMHACDFRTSQGVCVGWEPSANMIIFLGALAGVDVAQYLSKGLISKSSPISVSEPLTSTESEAVETTTDISELSEQEKG
jgi:hypothetical protein